jgi:hypothetical protein
VINCEPRSERGRRESARDLHRVLDGDQLELDTVHVPFVIASARVHGRELVTQRTEHTGTGQLLHQVGSYTPQYDTDLVVGGVCNVHVLLDREDARSLGDS